MIVLDASALLAFMFRESGHHRVAEVIDNSCMSCVNMAEVIARFTRDGHDGRAVGDRLRASAIEWVPFDEINAEYSAALVPETRQLGLSLGDRACLALGITRNALILTADRAWADLRLSYAELSIEIIR